MTVAVLIERVVEPAALAEVAALEAATFSNPWTLEMLQQEMSRNQHARLYVVRLPDMSVAAFCSCWVIFDELHINTIAVEERRRRQGLARALLQHVFADAAAAGARRATLEVRNSNHPARQLYAALGFAAAGIRRGYYTHPDEDALILWRNGLPGHDHDQGSDP
jgi:ribosomal-protein-alanine N-acetyltransferase